MSVPPSLLRYAPSRAFKAPSVTTARPAARCVVNGPSGISRGLATVNHDQRTLPEVGFAGSTIRSSSPGPGANSHERKPDERTLKLGKSMSFLCFISLNCLANVYSQPYVSSKSAYQPSSSLPSHKRSSRRRSPSTSSPLHTLTSLRSLDASHILLLYGRLL